MELQPHILEPQPHIGWVGGELKNKAKLSQVLLNLSLGWAWQFWVTRSGSSHPTIFINKLTNTGSADQSQAGSHTSVNSHFILINLLQLPHSKHYHILKTWFPCLYQVTRKRSINICNFRKRWITIGLMDLQEVQYQNLLLLNPLNYLIFTKRTISDYGSPSSESDYSDYASCNILYVYNWCTVDHTEWN